MTNLIHPTAEVSTDCSIGEGTRIWNQAQITGATIIGAGCTIGKGVYIGNASRIGNNVKIQNYANLFGIVVDDTAFIGPMVCAIEDVSPRSMTALNIRKSQKDFEKSPVVIKYGASIGAGAILTPGTMIGKYALVGAGAVVSGIISDYALIIGNPARQCGYVCNCGKRLDVQSLRCSCGICFVFRDGFLTSTVKP